MTTCDCARPSPMLVSAFLRYLAHHRRGQPQPLTGSIARGLDRRRQARTMVVPVGRGCGPRDPRIGRARYHSSFGRASPRVIQIGGFNGCHPRPRSPTARPFGHRFGAIVIRRRLSQPRPQRGLPISAQLALLGVPIPRSLDLTLQPSWRSSGDDRTNVVRDYRLELRGHRPGSRALPRRRVSLLRGGGSW